MSKIKGTKSYFSRVTPRVIAWDKKLEIYTNGADNKYPEETERLTNGSVTATMASRLMTQYLVGKGFGKAVDSIEVNSEGCTLIREFRKLAKSLTSHRGAFIQFEYGLIPGVDLEAGMSIAPVGFKVLPFKRARLGKKDSKEYSGKILLSDNWADPKKDKIIKVDVFNPRPDVVLAQVSACRGNDLAEQLMNYNGQILYINLDEEYYYPLATIDPVRDECDSERQAGLYRNNSLESGFFGKTLVVTRPLVDNDLIEPARVQNAHREDVLRLQEAESEREEFRENLSDFVGAENTGGVMHVELEFSGEKLEDALLVKNIEANIDDKMFEYTEDRSSDKILMAFNNLPKILISSKDSALFGSSGELLKEAKASYWESCTEMRETALEILSQCLQAVDILKATTLTQIPLLKQEANPDTAQEENRKAQAQLRGSVGGVTALLELQKAVQEQTTSLESAVAIAQEIFGFAEETARRIIGAPKVMPTQ